MRVAGCEIAAGYFCRTPLRILHPRISYLATAMLFRRFHAVSRLLRGAAFDFDFGAAIAKGAIQVGLHDIRDWTTDKHRVTDDYPFGGGAGMVMKAEPVARGLEDVLNFTVGVSKPPCPVIYLSPQGRTLNQSIVHELAAQPRLALLCGHYEGVDERAIQSCITDEISLGDFVLTGGEGAAAILIEAVARWVPEVLGNENSAPGDSFANGLLETPHYTRPAQWRGKMCPKF